MKLFHIADLYLDYLAFGAVGSPIGGGITAITWVGGGGTLITGGGISTPLSSSWTHALYLSLYFLLTAPPIFLGSTFMTCSSFFLSFGFFSSVFFSYLICFGGASSSSDAAGAISSSS